ncbi:MAG: hypothetical protein JXB39_07855 [Deltaproteobacteria bacterium]|nr:hypothetical protein [Deltaproteobacteria bacterium]
MPDREAHRFSRLLAPSLLAGLWALAVCRILAGPTSRVFSSPVHLEEDLPLHLWQYWWVGEAMSRGLGPFRSDMLTFPVPLDLGTLWGGHLDLLLGLPVAAAFGPVAAHNWVVVVMLALCGVGVYALAHEVSGSRPAAAMAGCLVLASPPLLREALAGRVEEMSFGLVALALAGGIRYLRGGRARDLVLGGGAMAAAFAAYVGTAMMSAFLLPCLAVGYGIGLARDRRLAGRPVPLPPVRRLVAVGAVLALLGGALFAYGLAGLGARWLPLASDPQAYGEWIALCRSVDLPLDTLLDPLPAGRPLSLGPVLPLAAVLALAPGRGRALPWWIASGLMAFLSLGPDLGSVPGLGTLGSPYRLLPFVFPFFLRFHWPYRFLLLAAPTLAVLAAVGHVRWRDRLPRSRIVAALPVVFSLLAVLQVHRLLPLPVLALPPLPATYLALAEHPGAIVELAEPHQAVYNPVLAQMHHGRPLCCLDLPAVLRPLDLAELEGRRTALARAARWSDDYGAGGSSDALDPGPLRDLGFAHVVVHRPCGSTFVHYAQGDPGARGPGGPGKGASGVLGRVNCARPGGSDWILREALGPPVREERLPDGWLVVYALGGASTAQSGSPR